MMYDSFVEKIMIKKGLLSKWKIAYKVNYPIIKINYVPLALFSTFDEKGNFIDSGFTLYITKEDVSIEGMFQ